MLYCFEDIALDTSRRELRHADVLIPVQPQVFDLLEFLLRNRDHLVSRDELLAAVWGGRIVSDSTLDTRINAARRAVGDDGKHQRLIRTLPRRGIRFVGEVREAKQTSPPRQDTSAAVGMATMPMPAKAERRQLTIISCDFVGLQALAARIDPEELRNVIGACHACCSQAAERWQGSVARFADHGATIHFSYPQAHEDDAERAVRTGLDLIERIARLEASQNHSLSARVGIATGLVVVDTRHEIASGKDGYAFGEAPTLAAALRSAAAPGSVLIADSTHDLLGATFEFQPVGPLVLNGFPSPIPAWQVSNLNIVESRFEARRKARATAFFGREQELKALCRKWAEAKTGSGRVVLISGEAGIGKSRIVAQLGERLANNERYTRVLCQCSPHYSDSALHPFISYLQRYAVFSPQDTPNRRYDKLEAVIAIRGAPRQTAMQLLASLLSIPDSGRYPPLTLSPQQQRRQTFAALLDQLEAVSRRQPLLLVFEDAHWADATSIELLDLMMERIRRLPVLALITFRPEFQPPWAGLPNVTTLPLGKLGQQDACAMVEQLTGRHALPAEVIGRIVAKADGIPLFVEELTRGVLASVLPANGNSIRQLPPPLSIPSTVQDSLAERLDRLGSSKEIAQIGAVIGRDFSYRLLHAAARMDDDALRKALAQLEAADIVSCRGTPPQATYAFRHALMQDAAYDTLLREPRRALHARIAETLENQFAEIADNQPEILAHHCTQAGLIGKAVDFWGKAGRRSLARSALVEAAEQLRRALALIDTLPATPRLRRERIDLQVALINPLVHLKGYAAPETKAAADRALALIEEADALGEPPDDPLLLFSVRYSVWVANYVSFDGAVIRELATQFLALAEKRGMTVPLVIGHRLMGRALLSTGEIAQGARHFQRALALYDPEEQRRLATRFGQDVEVSILSYAAIALWILGYYDRAAADAEQSLKDAREVGQAATLMYALYHTSFTHIHCGDYAAARLEAEELVALADEKEALYWKARGIINRGCVAALTGDAADAVKTLTCGIDAYQSTGASLFMPWYLAALAWAHAETAQVDEARRCIGEAIAAIETTQERWYEAEVNRIAGEIALKSPGRDAAKAYAYFENALAIARRQQAKSFELRAAMSIARLWRDEGKGRQARDLLTPVYAWFTEGLQTNDLKEARALLKALAA